MAAAALTAIRSCVARVELAGSHSVFASPPETTGEPRVVVVSLAAHGLGNRLRTLSRSLWLARASGRDLLVDWHASAEQGGTWEDLFVELPSWPAGRKSPLWRYAGTPWLTRCRKASGSCHVSPRELARRGSASRWMLAAPANASVRSSTWLTHSTWHRLLQHQPGESCWLVGRQPGCRFAADAVVLAGESTNFLTWLTRAEEERLMRWAYRRVVWPLVRPGVKLAASVLATGKGGQLARRLAASSAPPVVHGLAVAMARVDDSSFDYPVTTRLDAVSLSDPADAPPVPGSDPCPGAVCEPDPAQGRWTVTAGGAVSFAEAAPAGQVGRLAARLAVLAVPESRRRKLPCGVLVLSNSEEGGRTAASSARGELGALSGDCGVATADQLWPLVKRAICSGSIDARCSTQGAAATRADSDGRGGDGSLDRGDPAGAQRALAEWWAAAMAGAGGAGGFGSSFFAEAGTARGAPASRWLALAGGVVLAGTGAFGGRPHDLSLLASPLWAPTRAASLTAHRRVLMPELRLGHVGDASGWTPSSLRAALALPGHPGTPDVAWGVCLGRTHAADAARLGLQSWELWATACSVAPPAA